MDDADDDVADDEADGTAKNDRGALEGDRKSWGFQLNRFGRSCRLRFSPTRPQSLK